jgi:MoxR-like ATPase
MPSDITGTDIIEQDDSGKRNFRFVKGPIFCNILLADEINRTPPKTQAALLQSMQETQVTAGGQTYPLSPPFHVFATQNPIEQEGTYPLPEAQLDRFMMMLHVPYPSEQEEMEIVRQTTGGQPAEISRILGPEAILKFQDLVLRVPISDPLVAKAVQVVRQTRPGTDNVSDDIQQYVSYGAGPRATQHLVLASKARAILNGRQAVDIEDLRALVKPVLRHRIITNFNAEARKITADQLVDSLLHTLAL